MNKFKKGIALLLVVVMLLPGSAFSFGEETDISNHWAKDEIEYLMGKNIVSGYPNGDFKPDQIITRAEFVKIVNSVFGYSKVGKVEFEDVNENDWFYNEIGKALEAGYIGGYSDNTMKADSPISRQEASKIMGIVFDLDESKSKSANNFVDGSKIGDWAKGYVSILKDKGYISGYLDKTFKPTNPIKRAEAVKILKNASGNIINQIGEYTENLVGNVLVNTSDVILKGMKIKGDLYLTEGIGEGNLTLDNVNVEGKTYIRGGGENSIIVINSKLGEVVVNKKYTNVRVVIDENTDLSNIVVNDNTILVIKKGGKIKTIKVIGKSKIEIEEGAEVGNIEVKAKNVEIKSKGKIDSVVSTEDVKINDKLFKKGEEINIEKEVSIPPAPTPMPPTKPTKISVSAITVNKIATTLTVGATETITATVEPSNASNKKVTWSSSDTGVATVDANGKITAVAVGNATITVSSIADSSKKATVEVIVLTETSEEYFVFEEATGTITDYKAEGPKDVAIPDKIGGVDVEVIGNKAFSNKYLTSVVIPNSVTSIGKHAFIANKLTSVVIPDSVTSINQGAFSNNELTSINIPNSITTIEKEVFQYNKLTSVVIPDSVTTIGQWAFLENELTSIEIPNSVTTIGPSAFLENKLTSLVIPNSVKTIEEAAFNNNKLPDAQAFIYARKSDGTEDKSKIVSYGGAKRENVIIPNSVKTIGEAAFAQNELLSITIPNSVTTIEDYAFEDNKLTEVTIPISVTTLGDGAFEDNGPSSNSGTISTIDFVGTWEIKDSSEVWTKKGVVSVSAITVTSQGDATTVVNGKTLQMGVDITPTTATNQKVTWSVSDGTGTATISTSGLLTATGVGKVTVKAVAQDGSGEEGTKEITIKPNDADKVATAKANLGIGYLNDIVEDLTLPTTQDDATVLWASSNEGVIATDGTVVRPENSDGNATVTLTATLKVGSATDTKVFVAIVKAKAKTQYTLTLTGDNISSAPGAGLVDNNASVTVTVSPAAGKQVASFTVGGADKKSGLVANKYTFTITADTEVKVTYEDISVTGVILDQATLNLVVGGATETLVATVNPSDAANKVVTWSSSDEAVATVADGVVTPLSAGSTTITVTTDDGGKTATCDVTVAAESFTLTYIAGTGGTITGTSSQTVSSGGDGTLVTATPDVGYSFDKWSDGITTAERTDTNVTANITVTAQFEINKYTVTFKDYDGTELETQTVEHGSGATAPTEPTRTGYTFTGWDVDFSNVTSDLTVKAKYTEDASETFKVTITGDATKTTDYTITGADNLEAVVAGTDLTVTAVTNITVNGDDVAASGTKVIKITEATTITINKQVVTPETYTVTTSGDAVKDTDFEITGAADLTAVAKDTTLTVKALTAITVDGSDLAIGATKDVVITAATDIVINKQVAVDKSALTTAIAEAETNKGTVTVSTDGKDVDPDNKWVTEAEMTAYESAITTAQGVADNTSATQTEVNNAVNALATATLTFDGLKKVGTKVAVTDVTLDKSTLNLIVDGATGTLVATVNPTEATNKNVTWTSSNETVATVADGIVTPLSVGSTTITVTTEDGGKTATCNVTVSASSDTKITLSAIPGITIPVTGAIPDTTEINEDQYTGTIAWSLDGAAFDTPFAAEKSYTATITLAAESGYTLAGVTKNFFTVDGATTTNAENDGIVTAVFSTTGTVTNNIKIIGTDNTEYTLNNLPKGLSWDGSILTMNNFKGKYIHRGSNADDLDKITINLVGNENKLTAGSNRALSFSEGITIQGEEYGKAKLILESKSLDLAAVRGNMTIQENAKVTINIDKSTKRAVFGNVTVKGSGNLEVNTVGGNIVRSSVRVANRIYLEGYGSIKVDLTNEISTESDARIASDIPYIHGKAVFKDSKILYYEKSAYKVVGEWSAIRGTHPQEYDAIKLTYTVPNSVDKLYTGDGNTNYAHMKMIQQDSIVSSVTMYSGKSFTSGTTTSIDLSTDDDNIIYVRANITEGDSTEEKYYIITIKRDKAGVAEISEDKEALTADSIKGENTDLDNVKVALKNPLPSTGAKGSNITWQSNKTEVVSNDGQIIKRPNAGNETVILTATLKKDSLTETKDFVLTVLELEPSTIEFANAGPITKIFGDPAFTNGVSGDGAGAITYSSEDTGVATVDSSSGEVTIVGIGTTVITASKAATTSHATVTNSYTLTVNAKALEGIDPISGIAKVGEKLTAGSVTPSDATLNYQWLICDTADGTYANIEEATNKTYTILAENANKFIKVAVTGTGNYSGTVTSDATVVVANAEQAAPTGLEGVAPTSTANSDGKITGTTTEMEYKSPSESDWTPATETVITGLAAGEYLVRYAAKTGYNASPETTVTVSVTKYTVTYDANTGTGTAPTQEALVEGGTFTVADTTGLTAPEGKQFKEWNTSADGTGTPYAVGSTFTVGTENVTLYAIWEEAPSAAPDANHLSFSAATNKFTVAAEAPTGTYKIFFNDSATADTTTVSHITGTESVSGKVATAVEAGQKIHYTFTETDKEESVKTADGAVVATLGAPSIVLGHDFKENTNNGYTYRNYMHPQDDRLDGDNTVENIIQSGIITAYRDADCTIRINTETITSNAFNNLNIGTISGDFDEITIYITQTDVNGNESGVTNITYRNGN